MATVKRRTGVIKYLGNVIDDTKDLVDDILDRARDVERDVRDTARKTLANDDEDDVRHKHDLDDLDGLKKSLLELTRKVDELSLHQNEKSTESVKTT